jgi:cell migration-inducing and hyaluronan-binding protein
VGHVIHEQINTANPPKPEDCRFPFVRMGGQSTYQRSTLTANHGTYYIDTTVPQDIQYGSAQMPSGEPFSNIVPCEFNPTGSCQRRSVNVFKEREAYTVYFLYAKSGDHATQQTYQVYVGDGFKPATDAHAVKVGLNTSPVTHVTPQAWPPKWQVHYNDAVACPADNQKCGILQVTVDFKDFDLSPTSKVNGLCQPQTFCKWSGDTCGCAFDVTDPRAQASRDPRRLVRDCTHACGQWAVKDLDFVGKETWGFSFTLPKGFTPEATLANPSPRRPQPSMFPGPSASTSKPNWATKFMRTTTTPDNTTGECHYAKLPGSADCPGP